MENTQLNQSELATSYDELRYYSKPFSFTSIPFLEASAYLWGLTPPAIKGAKVLELGSSFGGNLISQAVYYPETEFVGIDLSSSQINQGNEIIKSMGLNNVRLEAKNILHITSEFGKFDYIIAHGIYSWVPDEVKSKILDICRDNLSENGIAYISYNTYPGWKSKEVARDIMLFTNKHTSELPLSEQMRRGKVVVKLFSDAIKTIKSVKEHNSFRINNFDDIQDKDDSYIAHEYLETYNHPFYLNEFVDEVCKHQLAYIGDTDFQLSFTSWMQQHLRDMIIQLTGDDYVAREQCIDYLYDVAFRRSLLCHANLQGNVNHTEEVPKAILDKLTFLTTNKENNLSTSFNNPDIVRLFEYFIFSVGEFSIQDLKDYVVKNKDLKHITEDMIYSASLLSIILDYVNIYLMPYKTYQFEDNKTYVPARFTHYVEKMLNGATQYIEFGDMYNRTVVGILPLHLHIMSEMRKPITKAALVDSLQKYLIENNYKDMDNNEKPIDEEFDATGLCSALCQDLEVFGYIRPILEADLVTGKEVHAELDVVSQVEKTAEVKSEPKKEK
ncbi:MAG: methyltransferase regulatory domain-containing protein [Haemophilus parahaemolyticus]|uniref:methyltransferase regulatory domain-containing protein n=1 Tax=Haemophilus parahaemolyticus TaxID=735 RepID=UPI0026EED0F9|nr:methyltransferase regulatory domain-containing protein [Haemophilus parahaemolyticus]MBS6009055.1 methyltransferase regulatory domain-containing protein [Haemophilus parahaemolyticus]